MISRTVLMSRARSLSKALKQLRELVLISVALVTTEVRVEACSLGHYKGALLVSEGHITTEP